jgi:antiviral helicase SKI2
MNELAIMQEEITSLPELPEVEWTRLRALEFQEALRQRTSYTDRLAKLGCQLCDNFEDHVSVTILGLIQRADISTQHYMKSRW